VITGGQGGEIGFEERADDLPHFDHETRIARVVELVLSASDSCVGFVSEITNPPGIPAEYSYPVSMPLEWSARTIVTHASPHSTVPPRFIPMPPTASSKP